MTGSTFLYGKIRRLTEEQVRDEEDRVAVEEPLEIRFGAAPIAVTMRTPGHDPELAAGFLFTEGIIHRPEDVVSIHGPKRDLPNVVRVKPRRGLRFDRRRLERHFYTHSSCGVCGKASLQSIQIKTGPITSAVKIPRDVLYSLPEKLLDEQETFEETGGLHGAAVFDAGGRVLYLREDVGRHNAVDKVIGAAFLEGRLPLDRQVLVVSGRASFEIMQKAVVARVPIVAAVSAPSSLAVALARRFKMTLVGFLRGRRCNVYAGAERIEG